MDDFETRRKGFLEGYGELVGKFKCDFLNIPMFVPGGESRTWDFMIDTKIMDTTDTPSISPFQM